MLAYVKDVVIKQINGHQTRLQPNPGVYFSAKYADEWTKEQKEDYGVYENSDNQRRYYCFKHWKTYYGFISQTSTTSVRDY